MNPFLDDSFHIPWSELNPERVVPDLTLALERAEALAGEILNMCARMGGSIPANMVLEWRNGIISVKCSVRMTLP